MAADLRVERLPPEHVDREEWESLLDRASVPAGLAQRFDSAKVDAEEGLGCRFVQVRDREGRLVGGTRITVERRFPSRHIEMDGGPVFLPDAEPSAVPLLAGELRNAVRVVDSGYLRPSSGRRWHLERYGLHPAETPLETVVVDLARSEEEIWRSVDHSVRQGARKARDHGLSVRELTTETEVDRVYPLIDRFGRLRDFPIIHRSRLLATFRQFHPVGGAFVLACESDGVTAGVAVIVLTNRTAGLLVVAGDPAFAKLQMVSLLDWEAIRFCRDRGATAFDFLGLPPAGSGLDGLRRFKLKWGGRVEPGEEYLEGVLFRFATSAVRRWPRLFRPVLMQRGPFRRGAL